MFPPIRLHRWQRWSVTALGVLLCGVIVGAIVITHLNWTMEHQLQFAVPILLSLSLIGYGAFLAWSALPTERITRIALWSLAGTIVLGSFATWEMYLHLAEGEAFTTTIHELLLGGTEGALVGGLVGYYNAQRRAQHHEAKRAKRAITASIDGIALLNEEGRYTEVNQAHADVYGYDSPEAFLGNSWRMCYTNAERELIEQEVFPALQEDSHWRGELTGKRRDGSPFPQEVTLTTNDEGMVCVVRDITERKRREHRFQALFENLHDPAVIVELTEDDTITREVNSAFEDVFGYPAETAVGESLDDLIVPPELKSESEQLDQRARSGESFITDVRRQTADGDLRDFLFRSVRIKLPGGKPGAHGIYTDITERKRREQELRNLHDATRDMLAAPTRQAVADIASAAASNILELRLNGGYLYDEDANGLVPVATSQRGEDVVGSPPILRKGTSIGWRVFERSEAELYDDVRTAPGVSNSETPIRSELLLPLEGHGIFIAGAVTVGDFDETDVSLANVLAATVQTALDRVDREQTLQHQKQELQHQNDRLDEFAGMVSHDLRNPLNVATGHLDLARKTGDAKHFEAITRSLTRMERLIADVLSLARQGDAIGDTEPLALDTVARRAWDTVETGPATLHCDTDREIAVNASRVGQLFENLFRNAIEHGGEAVTVHVGWLTGRTGFYIEDTGPGIPREEQASVFESGYTTDPEGTGFGLAIVEEITRAHGWDITVTDGADGGARFEITTEPAD